MAERKDAMAVISRFEKLAKDKKLTIDPINRHTQRWAAEDVLDSFGKEEVYDSMEYYFNVSAAPSWVYFVRNLDRISKNRKDRIRDLVERRERLEKFRKIVNESRG